MPVIQNGRDGHGSRIVKIQPRTGSDFQRRRFGNDGTEFRQGDVLNRDSVDQRSLIGRRLSLEAELVRPRFRDGEEKFVTAEDLVIRFHIPDGVRFAVPADPCGDRVES